VAERKIYDLLILMIILLLLQQHQPLLYDDIVHKYNLLQICNMN
jgi:hypothetical protein